MFTSQQLFSLNNSYFEFINIAPDGVTIKSRCTGHTWNLLPYTNGAVRILHKHNDGDKYHWHAVANSFEDAVAEIYYHDEYQLNGRRPTYRVYTRKGIILCRRKGALL